MKPYILQAFMEFPWAILPSKLAALEAVVIRHAAGEKLSADEVQAAIHGAQRPADRRVNAVAVLPLFGTIFPRANLLTDMSGATSAERFGAQFTALVDDPTISAIVLDIDSPGGQACGVPELSQRIFDARGIKPIIAVANHCMASAAYWIGTSADEVVVTPSGDVGSVGVFSVHEDMSAALEKDGYKISIIRAGKYKIEANPYEPLSDEARAEIQAGVDETYNDFLDALARNRGVSASDVRSGFGEGRMLSARQAVKAGMADRIGTLEETINRLLESGTASASMRQASQNHTVVSGSSSAVDEHPQNQNDPAGQEPGADLRPASDGTQARLNSLARRLALAEKSYIQSGEMIMNVRELLSKRAANLTAARALHETADQESRDLTETERAEFGRLLTEADSLAAQIAVIEAERAKLTAAEAFVLGVSDEPIKPVAASDPKLLTRAEFNKLSALDQRVFIKSGGKVE